ncbi:pre-rRNA-processing protein TSR1 homolog isoform X1 [Portunus trituberculatus]|uniref:pre-rRNA-processing protein TSR1 homolog isoform X1 n=1 Tax=Portunus trituberculatus TaxID=210409 RepID=UPI001E1D1C1B|nr:pre-rRNA-processing protein TSR1 homolog isoform X1 [Portunus trituberculatus]
MAMSQAHRPSALKQQNKKHRTLGHKSKSSIAKSNKGRVAAKNLSKKIKFELNREQRKNQAKQIRASKKEEAAFRKRSLGTQFKPPFLVSVVPLSPSINPRSVLVALGECDEGATVSTSPQGITHISSQRFKQRFSFVIPPANDLYAILDSVKTSDTLLLLWPGEEELGGDADLLLSSIMAQGLPTPVHVVTDLEELAQKEGAVGQEMETDELEQDLGSKLSLDPQPTHFKPHKKHQMKQNLIKEIETRFPGSAKLHTVEKPQDALLILRHIGAQKQRPIFFRDNRPHIMAEKLEFLPEGPTGTLRVHGYLRGKPISVNGLVHIPGWGEFQMSAISIYQADPYPLDRRGKEDNMIGAEIRLLGEADSNIQETLISTNEVDPMEGEQTWPTEEELAEAEKFTAPKTRTKRVPKGTSDYQAAWIVDSDNEEGSIGDDEDDGDDSNMEEYAPVDAISQDGMSQDDGNDEDEESDEEYETVTVTENEGANYDEKVDYGEEMGALQKMREAREDAMFPDEVDTPQDVAARIRFQKYRGLQSFRTSVWDPNENLPLDYSRIFQFEDFQRTRKRVLREETYGAEPGGYLMIDVKEVPHHLYKEHIATHSPLVMFGLLPHEQKMSVVNFVVKSHPQGHFRPIKSKERLIFHLGFRRFANCPIFSEHTTGNKHKFARYFHPGSTVVATMFAPITFSPASVLVFRERADGAQDLVATGSLLSVDPKRIVTKRVVLSGHPFKVNRKTAVVRYMFFNREDVMWFKPVELRTKWGRRGHIKEPLGTHGHMKCFFNGQLKSQDTILLNLYKRMFPKWTMDPFVARPPPLYTFHTAHHSDSDDEEEEEAQQPSRKRSKMVKFVS